MAPTRKAVFGQLGPVCRLGLATRGNTALTRSDVLAAIERGVDYLNWCGHADGMSAAVKELGPRRADVKVAVQIGARTASACRREIDEALRQLGTSYVDVASYYYVEERGEWDQIVAPGGAAEALEEAKAAGRVRCIGLTSHQRRLAAEIAETGRLDMLMIRYNAAHRWAEAEVFPTTTARQLPVVTFTALRWGTLLSPVPAAEAEPAELPDAATCYRFALEQPAVTVVLMAPDGRDELQQNLAMFDDWRDLTRAERTRLEAHAARVRVHAPSFP